MASSHSSKSWATSQREPKFCWKNFPKSKYLFICLDFAILIFFCYFCFLEKITRTTTTTPPTKKIKWTNINLIVFKKSVIIISGWFVGLFWSEYPKQKQFFQSSWLIFHSIFNSNDLLLFFLLRIRSSDRRNRLQIFVE